MSPANPQRVEPVVSLLSIALFLNLQSRAFPQSSCLAISEFRSTESVSAVVVSRFCEEPSASTTGEDPTIGKPITQGESSCQPTHWPCLGTHFSTRNQRLSLGQWFQPTRDSQFAGHNIDGLRHASTMKVPGLNVALLARLTATLRTNGIGFFCGFPCEYPCDYSKKWYPQHW
eukprot:943322-Amphidinium_carterae.1